MTLVEQIILGVGAIVLILFLGPSARTMLEQSKNAENPDWNSVLVPIIMVILFVILLVMIAGA